MAEYAAVPATVLVVEDDYAVQEYLLFVLEEAGYNVALANNGLDALRYLEAHPPPSLILLDLMMPVINGWAFRAAQQREPTLAAIPVVMMSAGTKDEIHAHALGVAAYIAKPMSPDALVAAVSRYSLTHSPAH
jgi:CheY-like chemotaxis protein